MTIVIGLLVAVAAVLVVLEPILRPAAAAPAEPGVFDEPEDDPKVRRKELALAALKEIEFDRATGKLSESDYQAMLNRYTTEAVQALRDAEPAAAAGGNGHAAASAAPAAGPDPKWSDGQVTEFAYRRPQLLRSSAPHGPENRCAKL